MSIPTKITLIETVACSKMITKADARRSVEAVLDAMKQLIVKRGGLRCEFGTFKTQERGPRKAYNPITKESRKLSKPEPSICMSLARSS